MPLSIKLTPTSRLVKASDFKPSGKPLDFTKDHVVILDADNRPVAECRPLGQNDKTGEVQKTPKATPKPAPVVAAKPQPAPARSPGIGFAPNARLTDGQRELLTRLWMENPKSTAERVGELFEQRAGRTVSVLTVNTYRPGNAG